MLTESRSGGEMPPTGGGVDCVCGHSPKVHGLGACGQCGCPQLLSTASGLRRYLAMGATRTYANDSILIEAYDARDALAQYETWSASEALVRLPYLLVPILAVNVRARIGLLAGHSSPVTLNYCA